MKNFYILFFFIFLFNFGKAIATNTKIIKIESDLFYSGKIYFDVLNFKIHEEKILFGDKGFVIIDNEGKKTNVFSIIIQLKSSMKEWFNLKIKDGKFGLYPIHSKSHEFHLIP